MYLNLLDYTHNVEILKMLLRCVSESKKILYVDLTFIKDKPTLLSRVDNFKSLIPDNFEGLVNIIVAKEFDLEVTVLVSCHLT